MSELLAVEALRVEYAGRAVVEDVSFGVAAGRCLGIVGESGAGKSQAVLSLMGLLPPQARVSGRATLEGQGLLDGGAARLRGRRVAMIFQDPMTALTPHLTLGEQVAEPRRAHLGESRAAARAHAAALLARVGLTDVRRRMDQYPHELSGGMRQRVTLAMALAAEPALLIADEPTTALDVTVQAQILELLRTLLRERGMGLVIVTHDMGVIAALADDVAVMRAGRIVERAPVDRLLGNPANDYTRAFLAATPRMDEPLAETGARPVGGPALEVRGLSVRHRLRRGALRRDALLTAVDDVSFELHPGEALGIVGESGCGKSTLTRALLHLGPRAAGEVVWLGRPVLDAHGGELRALRAEQQIVFQDPFASLDPTMSVAEVVAEPLRALRPDLDATARDARVRDILARVGLGPEYAGRRSRELSGGQCQRVAIARAMVLAPKLLACDEAVSALDVSIQAQILELLASFRRQGTSILFVSHNLAVVRRLCARVVVMYLGRIVESGPTQAVFDGPRHPYTRALLASVPLLDPARERSRDSAPAAGEPPSAIERPAGCVFVTRCAAAQPRCAELRPGTERVAQAHEVACLRWRELPN